MCKEQPSDKETLRCTSRDRERRQGRAPQANETFSVVLSWP